MGAETIVEGYRTQEDVVNKTFVSCVTISYFGDIAFVQLLSGTFTTRCWRELYDYLENKGIRQVQYYRKRKSKVVLKVVWIDSKL